MSDQFIGEIRFFTYMRGAPSGWLACDGSVQQVSSYQTLAALLGTTYGGDGSSTFGLPDLRGRAPVHQGNGQGLSPRSAGQTGGSETVSLQTPQMPSHNHVLQATSASAAAPAPKETMPASLGNDTLFYVTNPSSGNALDLLPQTFGSVGSSTPHDNCAPSLPILACICTDGQWPARPN